jgi:aminoglycoside phosphotransferase (APT) family kinase protein
MEIAIRPRLSRLDVERHLRTGLGETIAVVDHEEFTDGFFNAAHGVVLDDGRRLVLKVAPDPGHKLLRYEVDLMATEIEFFQRAAGVGVPLPRLWHADPDGGVMIMDRLDGVSLPSVRDDMTESERLDLRRRIGELSARIGSVRGDHFGYPRRDGRTRSDSWGESFLAIIADVLTDSGELGVAMPRPVAEIGELVAGHRTLLDAVERPALVHFDLWDGNIFVRQGDGAWEIDGFIDGERAFYGDAIAELASLTMFVPAEDAEAVTVGFLGRGITADEDRRLCLYRVYLWMILAVECGVRGYSEEKTAEHQKWATENLAKELMVLEG